MLNLATLEYRVTFLASDGQQLDLTDVVTGLGYSEGSKELATKIQFKIAADTQVNGKNISELIQPFAQVFIFANVGDGFKEVTRGRITKVKFTETNKDFFLDVEAEDDAAALRRNQDDLYFTENHSASAILDEIFSRWGISANSTVKSVKLGKKVYRKKYLSDMIQDVLNDVKEKTGTDYFIRANGNALEIVERGKNSEVYSFSTDENVTKVTQSFDASSVVTKVKVVGKSKDDDHAPVEQTVDGKTSWGTRQIIYQRPEHESLDEATKAAKKILSEQGDVKRKTSIEAADVPFLRKGDRIRLTSSTGTSYFIVDSIRHNATDRKFTAELGYDKAGDRNLLNQVFDLAESSSSDSTAPP